MDTSWPQTRLRQSKTFPLFSNQTGNGNPAIRKPDFSMAHVILTCLAHDGYVANQLISVSRNGNKNHACPQIWIWILRFRDGHDDSKRGAIGSCREPFVPIDYKIVSVAGCRGSEVNRV